MNKILSLLVLSLLIILTYMLYNKSSLQELANKPLNSTKTMIEETNTSLGKATENLKETIEQGADKTIEATNTLSEKAIESAKDVKDKSLAYINKSLFKGATLLNDISAKIAGDPKKKQEIFVSQSLGFKTGSFSLSENGKLIIKNLSDYISKHPYQKIIVEGHSDSTGNSNDNMDLSQKRASAAKQFLISQGIDPNRVDYKGFGDKDPVTNNTTEEGRANNRRVVFKVLRQ